MERFAIVPEKLFSKFVRKTRDELPAVIKAMEHDNEWVRLYAASILVALKPPVDDDVAEDAVLVLVGVFEKSSVIYKDRDEIAEAIAESDITPAAKKAAVPALTKALEDENKGVRREVAEALESIGTEAKDAVPMLITALGDESERVRKSAVSALEQIGPATEDEVPALTKLLANDNKRVRSGSAEALEAIGPAAKDAIPALIKALGDEYEAVWEPATEAF